MGWGSRSATGRRTWPARTRVTVSTAVSDRNVEVAEARRLGIPVLSRASMLAAIVALRRTIAVAGTHGKTTTSSMLALVLVEAGLHPSFIIGGDVNEIGTNATWDEGEWLVVEADESDGTFLQLEPELGIVTSVESDHLEHYGSFEALQAAFGLFFAVGVGDRLRGRLGGGVVGTGFGRQLRLLTGRDDADRGGGVRAERTSVSNCVRAGASIGVFELPVPGIHNARNAAAAVTAACELGVGPGPRPAGARPFRRRRAALRVPRRA